MLWPASKGAFTSREAYGVPVFRAVRDGVCQPHRGICGEVRSGRTLQPHFGLLTVRIVGQPRVSGLFGHEFGCGQERDRAGRWPDAEALTLWNPRTSEIVFPRRSAGCDTITRCPNSMPAPTHPPKGH